MNHQTQYDNYIKILNNNIIDLDGSTLSEMYKTIYRFNWGYF